MKVIYFSTYGGERYSGINKKIFAQASDLYQAGVDIDLVLLGGFHNQYPDNTFTRILPIPDNFFFTNNLIKRFYRQYLAKQFIKKIIKTSDSSTILYLRYPLPVLLLPHDLSDRRSGKIVIECNSIEINELKSSKLYFSYFLELLLGKGFRKHCDAIIGVTDEITRYQVQRSGNLKIPHLTLGNGFDVNTVPVRRPPALGGSTLNILCVADVTFWHGIDRLITGISQYKGDWNILLHIAGGGDELPSLKQLASTLKINDHIIFHGFVHGKDLDRLFEQNHIAVGSLGIHRIGLHQLSILKAREYCARGIPYIIACSDPDFPEDFPYILRLPADDSPIDMNQVITFSSLICQDQHHPEKMRHYARKNLEWSVKMKKLKVFLEGLCNQDCQTR
jgi:glycosyltransferase involved in cell wall biosynthesis